MATVPGRYLIVDLSQEPPALVTTDDVLPQAILDALAGIDAKLGALMSMAGQEQAQIQTLADGMNAVAAHVTSAQATLAQWIADNQQAPLDFTPAMNALASVGAAANTLDGLTPQAPSDPIQPIPAPPDPAPDPTQPVTDPGTPDLPPDTSIDPGTAADPTTTPNGGTTDTSLPDAGGATDGIGVDPGVPPDQAPLS